MLLTLFCIFNHSDFRLFSHTQNAQKVLNLKFLDTPKHHQIEIIGSATLADEKPITYLVFVNNRLEIGNKTGISNEMHAHVLREKKKKLPRKYLDVIKYDSWNAVDVDFI